MQDHKKDIDPDFVAHCIMNEAVQAEPFYPSELEDAANALGITQGNISLDIAQDVYIFLVCKLEDGSSGAATHTSSN